MSDDHELDLELMELWCYWAWCQGRAKFVLETWITRDEDEALQ